jgi:hypothetical protein
MTNSFDSFALATFHHGFDAALATFHQRTSDLSSWLSKKRDLSSWLLATFHHGLDEMQLLEGQGERAFVLGSCDSPDIKNWLE